MPRRPRRAHRRAARKPRRRAAGRAGANTKVVERVVYRTTLNSVPQQSTVGGVGAFINYQFSPQHLTYYNISQSSEFLAQRNMYDEFKITSMTVQFKPYATQTFPNNGTTTLSTQCYTCIDRDGQVPVSTSMSVPLKIMSYDSAKTHLLQKSWSRTMRLKGWWTDTGLATLNPALQNGTGQPWINAGAVQTLTHYGENLPFGVGSVFGQYTVTWRVQFRGKKPVSFSYHAASGSVVLTPFTSFSVIPSFNPPRAVADVIDDEAVVDCSGGSIIVKATANNELAAAP